MKTFTTVALITLVLLFSNHSFAQNFNKIYGGSGNESFNRTVVTSDGGYLSVGTISTGPHGLIDILLVKTSSAGVLEWSRAYGTTGNDYGIALDIASTGEIIVGGYLHGTGGVSDNRDVVVYNISADGQTVNWSRRYNLTIPADAVVNRAETLLDLKVSGNTIYFTGLTSSNLSTTTNDVFCVSTSLNGQTINWATRINGDQDNGNGTFGNDDLVYSMRIVGTEVLLATALKLESTPTSQFDCSYISLNSTNGQVNRVISYREASASGDEGVMTITKLSGGDYVLAGFTRLVAGSDIDIDLTRITAAGVLVWSKQFGNTSSDRPYAIEEVSDGLLITGFSTYGPFNQNDIFVMKTDFNGVQQSVSYIAGDQQDNGNGLTRVSATQFLVSGNTTSSFGAGQMDGVLTLVDQNGLVNSNCASLLFPVADNTPVVRTHSLTAIASIWQNTAMTLGNSPVTLTTTTFPSCTLPVTFLNISKGEQNSIRFTTTDEKDLLYYQIQISNDGVNFIDLQKIQPKNTNGIHDYVVNLEEAPYVRVLGVDNTGNIDYSKVIALQQKSSGYVVKGKEIYFNQPVDVKVYASNATEIVRTPSVTKLNLENYEAGIYMVYFSDGEDIQSIKIPIQ
ncbi:MAG: hypothetical protein U0U66_12710 [Cytophagaceae bacterium]